MAGLNGSWHCAWLLHRLDVRLPGDWGRSLVLQSGGKGGVRVTIGAVNSAELPCA
jgi:hypothetical protein